jgi:hypothetical protein
MLPAYSPTNFDRLWRWSLPALSTICELRLLAAVENGDTYNAQKWLFRLGGAPRDVQFSHIILSTASLSLVNFDHASSYPLFQELLHAGFRMSKPGKALIYLAGSQQWPAVFDLLKTHTIDQAHASVAFCAACCAHTKEPAAQMLLEFLAATRVDPFTRRDMSVVDAELQGQAQEIYPWNSAIGLATSEVVEALLNQAPRMPLSQECSAMSWRTEPPLSSALLYRMEKGGVRWEDVLLSIMPNDPPHDRLATLYALSDGLEQQLASARAIGQCEYLNAVVPPTPSLSAPTPFPCHHRL